MHANNPIATLAGGCDDECGSRVPARAAEGNRLARCDPAARGGRGAQLSKGQSCHLLFGPRPVCPKGPPRSHWGMPSQVQRRPVRRMSATWLRFRVALFFGVPAD
eukprot:12480662-Alexandrium_andersonii.AAC.1